MEEHFENESGTYTFQHGQQVDQKLRTLKACKALFEEAATKLTDLANGSVEIGEDLDLTTIYDGLAVMINDTSLAITNEEDRLNERI